MLTTWSTDLVDHARTRMANDVVPIIAAISFPVTYLTRTSNASGLGGQNDMPPTTAPPDVAAVPTPVREERWVS